MIRLFVAIDLPDTIKQTLHRCRPHISGGRWVKDEQLHLTIRFIGEVHDDLLHDIRVALQSVDLKPFPLKLQGTGFFPSRRKPRVLWVGIEESSRLKTLHNRIESALVTIGIEPDNRRFVPHITLARFKSPPSAADTDRFLDSNSGEGIPPFTVRHFSLYSSKLNSTGAVHREEGRYPLHQ